MVYKRRSILTLSAPLALLFSVLLCCVTSFADTLPHYPELNQAKNFWVKVFSEIDTSNGFIHDREDLSIIYGKVSLKKKKSTASKIKKRLERLSFNLTPKDEFDAYILKLFGKSVTKERLKQASKNVRFQLGQSNRFRAGFKRGGAWIDEIKKIISDYSLPKEIVAMPFLESGYNPNARSHVGALGLWQFIRSTGVRFMNINRYIDERKDPIIATKAAAELLNYNYEILGEWPLAITAYNHGLGGIRRATRSVGSNKITDVIRDYQGPRFGFASRNFYVELLAVSHIYFNIEDYFSDIELNKPIKRDSIQLDYYAGIDDLSTHLDISKSTIAKLNPAFRKSVSSGNKRIPKNTTIFLPADSKTKKLNSFPQSKRYIAQVISKDHLIEPGDSLIKIAHLYNVKVSDLMLVNNLDYTSIIRSGQKLDLPTNANLKKAKKRIKKKKKITSAKTKRKPTLINRPVSQLLTDPLDYQVVNNSITVEGGETLGHYADWLEEDINKIRRINKLRRRDKIHFGQKIKLIFKNVSQKEFVLRRISYQIEIQELFFSNHIITGTTQYRVKRGDTLTSISLKHNNIPFWLIHQYNPQLSETLILGMRIAVPKIADKPNE